MAEKLKAITFDPYECIGVDETANKEAIVKAYRKAALKWHPDKHPDHMKKAAEDQFHRLSQALDILTDEKARAVYDRKRQAKRAAAERNSQLDAKRRKFKEELEAREQSAFAQTTEERRSELNLQAEIERLRKEGEELLRQEKEKQREASPKIPEESEQRSAPEGRTILQAKWKSEAGKPDYNQKILTEIFSLYEDNPSIVISPKNKKGIGKALIEFSNPWKAEIAIEVERGRAGFPKFELSWFQGKPNLEETFDEKNGDSKRFTDSPKTSYVPKTETPPPSAPKEFSSSVPKEFSSPSAPKGISLVSDRDFENVVLMKLRREEERKRLIQEMQQEEGT